MKEKRNHNELSMIWLLILLGWLLDVLTSFLGISMGIKESSDLFLFLPFMWAALFMGLSTFVYFFKQAPARLRKIIIMGIVLGSYIPMANNLFVIYLMVIS